MSEIDALLWQTGPSILPLLNVLISLLRAPRTLHLPYSKYFFSFPAAHYVNSSGSLLPALAEMNDECCGFARCSRSSPGPYLPTTSWKAGGGEQLTPWPGPP